MITRSNFTRSKVVFFTRSKEQSRDQKSCFSQDRRNNHEIKSRVFHEIASQCNAVVTWIGCYSIWTYDLKTFNFHAVAMKRQSKLRLRLNKFFANKKKKKFCRQQGVWMLPGPIRYKETGVTLNSSNLTI